MKAVLSCFIFLIFSFSLFALDVKQQIVWHWEDEFSQAEKEKVQTWLFKVAQSTQESLGEFPFKMHFHVYRMEGKGEPVPWANTWKYPNQAVHFHIDPSFELEEFIADWTAPHEISHLALPYLGEDNAWFAEGFASYMQCLIMKDMGLFNDETMQSHLDSKWSKLKPVLNSNLSMVTLCREMREQKNYSGMYWGGASYFYLLDERLKKNNSSIQQVLKDYLECCRKKGRSLENVLEHWDSISSNDYCSDLLHQFSNGKAVDTMESLKP